MELANGFFKSELVKYNLKDYTCVIEDYNEALEFVTQFARPVIINYSVLKLFTGFAIAAFID
jgi:hypothetical protein